MSSGLNRHSAPDRLAQANQNWTSDRRLGARRSRGRTTGSSGPICLVGSSPVQRAPLPDEPFVVVSVDLVGSNDDEEKVTVGLMAIAVRPAKSGARGGSRAEPVS